MRFSSRMKAVMWLRTWSVHPNFIYTSSCPPPDGGSSFLQLNQNYWRLNHESPSAFGPDRTAAPRFLTGCNNNPISQLESRHPLSPVYSVVYPFTFLFIYWFIWLILNPVILQSHLIQVPTLKPLFLLSGPLSQNASVHTCISTNVTVSFFNLLACSFSFFFIFLNLHTSFNWVLYLSFYSLFVQGIWVIIFFPHNFFFFFLTLKK